MNVLIHDYDNLIKKIKKLTILRSAADIINWDMETKMPPKGINIRSEQLAMLTEVEHSLITNPKIGAILKRIGNHPDYYKLNLTQRRNVYLIRKNFDEQTKLPNELVAGTQKQRAITINKWKKAKAAKDFSIFKPELEKLFNLRKEAANILMEVKNTKNPYDALIDIYEPKMTSETIANIFNELKEGLIPLMERIRTSHKQTDISFLKRQVSLNIQRKISKSLVKFIEYDVESEMAGGRIDETEHPFTTGYYNDVRITTHYYENRFISSIFSILHEGGHAIYDQNLNTEWIYQPVGAGCSLGIHESQSRFVENIIGRSREFWKYFLPKLNLLMGNIFSDVDLDTFVFAINEVKPSKIRVEADEVTYCLHIIIRFEIERDLMDDKITVAETPEVWNQKYKNYLGMDIENDSEGVMQDTHWANGSIGYFPTYALGNIYSGQILVQMQKDLPNWKNQIAKGSFHNIKQWLRDNVYQYGNLYDPADLIRKITNEEIRIEHYLNYLNNKYSKLYRV